MAVAIALLRRDEGVESQREVKRRLRNLRILGLRAVLGLH